MTKPLPTSDGDPEKFERAGNPPPAVATDLYELLMAQGYWLLGWSERRAVFNLSFRKNPFRGGFVLACGQESVKDFLESFRFSQEDLSYLASLKAGDGRTLFRQDFLRYLAGVRFRCHVRAVREGTVVFANEPILQVEGPLLQAQLVETALLNLIGFPSLVATKAARICQAAGTQPVVEFGLRRAQGWHAGLTASRAAYIAGCAGTSNVAAGKAFGIPVRGTMAHSWVMTFADERDAFTAYGRAVPANCIFVVDTYDTEQGLAHALAAAEELRRLGIAVQGVRLDSGDLARWSREARRRLDEAGLNHAAVLVSGDLDEYRIRKLKERGACADAWGVGTRLATAFEEPALSVVYKLSAIAGEDGGWQDRAKISNDRAKHSLPGFPGVYRFYVQDRAVCDVIYDRRDGLPEAKEAAKLFRARPELQRLLRGGDCRGEDLLVPLMDEGVAAEPSRPVEAIRAYARTQLASLPEAVARLDRPERYAIVESESLRRRRRAFAAMVRRKIP
ncbi:MAG: nicotinate phosphoribosyltransferase [Thermogutta sp.]